MTSVDDKCVSYRAGQVERGLAGGVGQDRVDPLLCGQWGGGRGEAGGTVEKKGSGGGWVKVHVRQEVGRGKKGGNGQGKGSEKKWERSRQGSGRGSERSMQGNERAVKDQGEAMQGSGYGRAVPVQAAPRPTRPDPGPPPRCATALKRTTGCSAAQEGRHPSCERGCTRDDCGKAGPFSVERLKMDLPVVQGRCKGHNRFRRPVEGQ